MTELGARRRLSLHHLTVKDVSPPELIEIAAAIGLDQVCIFVRAPSRDLDRFPLIADAPTRQEVASRMAATGVQVHNIEVFSLTPRTRLEDFRAPLAMGASLGARRASALINDADEPRATDTLSGFCALAAEHGLAVSVEFMAFAVVNTLEKAVRHVTRAAQPNLSLAVDALHLRRTGGSVAALAALDPALIGYAQLCDSRGDLPPDAWLDEAIEDRCIPGEGDMDLQGFIAALPPAAVIDLEVPSRTLRQRGLGPLDRARRIAEAARRVLNAPSLAESQAELQ